MIGKSPKKDGWNLFRPVLEYSIDMNHESVQSTNKIVRSYFEKEPGVYYSDKEALDVPIRMIQAACCSGICTIWGMNVCRSIVSVMVTFGISVEVYFLSISFRLIQAILSISATESERKGRKRFLPKCEDSLGRGREGIRIGIVRHNRTTKQYHLSNGCKIKQEGDRQMQHDSGRRKE